jgi:hypothetical protein
VPLALDLQEILAFFNLICVIYIEVVKECMTQEFVSLLLLSFLVLSKTVRKSELFLTFLYRLVWLHGTFDLFN